MSLSGSIRDLVKRLSSVTDRTKIVYLGLNLLVSNFDTVTNLEETAHTV